MKTFDLTDK